MPTPISQSVQKALDRLENVLASPLFTDLLDERSTQDIPLSEPERWVQFRVRLQDHWRRLNVAEILGVIHCHSTDLISDYSGNEGGHTRTQNLIVDVGIVQKAPASIPEASTESGHLMIADEWMQRRAEMYRGAVIDTLTQYAADDDGINEIKLRSHQADLSQIPDGMRYAHSTITIEVYQNVYIKR